MQKVKVLDGRPGGTLDEVVDSTEDYDSAPDATGRKVAEIRAGDLFGGRKCGRNPHKRLLGVELPIEGEEGFVGQFAGRLGVAGGQNAAIHRGQVGRENDSHLAAGNVRENLVDLRHVAMRADSVGREVFIALGEMEVGLGFATGPADAADAIDDQAVWGDRAGANQRGESEDGRGRVTAWIGDEGGHADFVAIDFGQAIDGGVEAIGIGMGKTVPLGVLGRVVESVIRAEVDDFLAQRQKLSDGGRAGAMRQAAEDAIGAFGNLSGREIFESEIETSGKGRVDVANVLGIGLTRGEGGDLSFGMAQQELDQLESGVTRSAEDGHAYHVRNAEKINERMN